MVPKLVAEDIPLLHSLLSDVFPGVKYTRAAMKGLRAEISKVCAEMHLVYGETGSQWVDKVRRGSQWVDEVRRGSQCVGEERVTVGG
jgi:dynein heavy chain 1